MQRASLQKGRTCLATGGLHLTSFWRKHRQLCIDVHARPAEVVCMSIDIVQWLLCTAAQKLAGGPDLPRQMEEMDRELRQLQQQVRCSGYL